MIQPLKVHVVKHPFRIWGAYAEYFKSWKDYKKKGGTASFRYIYPVLKFSKADSQTGGGHYFYQDIWALRKLSALKPAMHYDIGSRFDGFAGQATAVCPVTSVDIRPPSFTLPDFHFIKGDILALPFESDSIRTLSCLHTVEHIGLGRYGDPLQPDGFEKALHEMQRVIQPGGYLILSMPVGKERTEFNAQRILDPHNCISLLSGMELLEFSIVDDSDVFIENARPDDYINAKYCCGLYYFRKLP